MNQISLCTLCSSASPEQLPGLQRFSIRFREAIRLGSDKSAGLPESVGSYSPSHSQAGRSRTSMAGIIALSRHCNTRMRCCIGF